MSPRAWAAVAALVCLPASAASDYPTTDRVQYVLECMYRHGGSGEYVYKCSCALDYLAAKFTYDEFVEASTVARYQTLGGEGGGVFRDSEANRALAKKYRDAENEAYGHCGIEKKK
jgi:hypothetical protein